MGNTYPNHKGNYYYRSHTLYHIGTLDPLGNKASLGAWLSDRCWSDVQPASSSAVAVEAFYRDQASRRPSGFKLLLGCTSLLSPEFRCWSSFEASTEDGISIVESMGP